MHTPILIANWKSNKTRGDALLWLKKIAEELKVMQQTQKTIILCPSFSLLSNVHQYITKENLPIATGTQDISAFPQGPYTGEVNGRQISEFATYSIIGHSERRELLGESMATLEKKVQMAQANNLTVIFCIQDKTTPVVGSMDIVAYEPPMAIGTGRPDTPENANAIASSVKAQNKASYVLYGGSVTSRNVSRFTAMDHIDGVLVGKASLDPLEFIEIIKNA